MTPLSTYCNTSQWALPRCLQKPRFACYIAQYHHSESRKCILIAWILNAALHADHVLALWTLHLSSHRCLFGKAQKKLRMPEGPVHTLNNATKDTRP